MIEKINLNIYLSESWSKKGIVLKKNINDIELIKRIVNRALLDKPIYTRLIINNKLEAALKLKQAGFFDEEYSLSIK